MQLIIYNPMYEHNKECMFMAINRYKNFNIRIHNYIFGQQFKFTNKFYKKQT